MKRVILGGVLVAMTAAPAVPLACGDKFLVPSRGARFQTLKADREAAAVLLYVRPGSGLQRTLSAAPVEATLRKAGYRPIRVDSEAALRDALSRRAWDVVVLDLADGPLVASRAPARTVLPIAHDVSRPDLDAARAQYRRVIAAPAKSAAFVDALDRLVGGRAKAAPGGRGTE